MLTSLLKNYSAQEVHLFIPVAQNEKLSQIWHQPAFQF